MLIGLIGKKSSGKDTFGNILIEYYGFTKRAFADPLKDCCQLLFHLTDEQLNDEKLKETIDTKWQMTPRQIMQKVGTDLFRNNFDSDFWLKLFENWYDQHKDINIVCTDIRFQNEANLIQKLGGIIIKINRSTTINDSHESEKLDIKTYDFEINNNSSLHVYKNKIIKLCNEILNDYFHYL